MPQPTLSDLQAVLDRLAPPSLAEAWDNVGLILGDPAWPLSGPILLTIDLTSAVVSEAINAKASAIIAYHPPIFTALKRITSADRAGSAVLELAARRIGILSPHTALDAAPAGLADWLLDLCPPTPSSLTTRRAIRPYAPSSASFKVITFVPLPAVDAVANAMAGAGAGVIGHYTHCSFRVDGTGTFLGGEGSNPAVGKRGELEHVGEMRLEMVCPSRTLPEVIAALRAAHPYEEPAFDISALAPHPDPSIGPGRIGTLSTAEPARHIVARVAQRLGCATVDLAGDADRMVRRVAVCPGAGSSLAEAAVLAGAELFITGEMSHHAVLAALDRKCAVALAGHTQTERPYLPTLAARLREAGITNDIAVARSDRAPLTTVPARTMPR